MKYDVTDRKLERVVAFRKWLKMTKNDQFLIFDPPFLQKATSQSYEPIFQDTIKI